MLNRIKYLCKQNGISVSKLEEETGISKNGIGRWENNIPSVDKVARVAEYFGVSLDWLVLGKDVLLSPETAELAQKWRKLDAFGKGIVMTVLDGEVDRCETINQLSEQKVNTFPILRSVQPASAGTGIEIGIADMEIVMVPETEETKRANFIVRVSGDSMLPIYQDGDQLLIEHADEINVGEIGIFVVDGKGYVKQRGISELISLNKDYKNIPISANTVCNGRVIGVINETDVK